MSWKTRKQSWNIVYLGICFVLMPINWYLESVKWQTLMSPHTQVPLLRALKTVFAGISLGIVTPARVGEYGGRLLLSDPDYKTEVISATLLGSIAQNLCNVMGGLIFSYFFLKMILVLLTLRILRLL
ncbi:MAG: hypothetical protein IPO92_20605 [Saprospiraceae bacterium]|nr:hypothetical protein [Saprospiraceae bacterium]